MPLESAGGGGERRKDGRRKTGPKLSQIPTENTKQVCFGCRMNLGRQKFVGLSSEDARMNLSTHRSQP